MLATFLDAVRFLCSALTVAASASPEASSPAGHALDYEIDAREESCPDEAAFRDLVAARMGRDPFVSKAERLLVVKIVRKGRKLQGAIRLQDADTEDRAIRELESPVGECEALAAAIAASVAIAIDPLGIPDPPAVRVKEKIVPALTRTATSVLRPLIVVQQISAPNRDEHVRTDSSLAIHVSIGGSFGMGVAPNATVGLHLGVGAEHGALSADVEGEVETTPSTSRVGSGDRIHATALSLALLPCAALRDWHICLVGRVGSVQFTSPDVESRLPEASLLASSGMRAAYTLDLSDALRLRLGAQAEISLVRTSVLIERTVVWTAPGFVAGALIGLRLKVW